MGYLLGPSLMYLMSTALSGTYLMQFYTDVIGVSGSLIIAMPLISKILLVIMNVVFSGWIAKTSTSQGKARPWLLLSGIILPIAGILLYMVPRAPYQTQILWILFSYNFFFVIAHNIYILSHSMMIPRSSRDSKERDKLTLFKNVSEGMIPGTLSAVIMPFIIRAIGVGEAEVLDLEVDMYGLSSYDENENVYLLEKGDYIIKVGDSSRNNKAVLVIENKEDIIVSKHDAICKTGEELNRLINGNSYEYDLRGVKRAVLDPKAFVTETYVYGKPAVYSDEKVDAILDQMNEKDMIDVVTGIGTLGMMDTNCFCVPGIAGKTTYKHLDKGLISVTLADGPGGLRLVRKSAVSKSGRIKMFKGNYLLSFMEVMPDWMLFFLKPGKKDTVFYQYATAFPVGTNLAQTWNQKLVEKIGLSVSKEMDKYNITYWLAPGMNIHKNPLCGRNFEYYSEDPVLSGKISAAMTRGVQSIPGNYTTIKHFACNNAEDNRGLSDSHVSQRALREIYLKGFEINIKEAGSKSLMTAYNKINGIYCPDSFDLCTKVLRNEWGFDGVVMTDWFSTKPGQGHTDLAVANGNDMIMPGDKVCNKTLVEGLKKGTLSKEDLRRASANIIRSIVYSNAAKKYKAEDFR